MNKIKLVLGVGLFVCVLALTGCAKKTTTGTGTTVVATSPAATDSQTPSTEPPGSGVQIEPSAVASAATTGKSSADQLTTTYNNNYAAAEQNANGALSNSAKFCTAVVEFPKGQITVAAQSFFFTSTNNALKDWYWVVEYNQLENTRLELFAAKRDYKDLTCTSLPNGSPELSYSNAYQKVQDSGALAAELTDDAVLTKIVLADKSWQFQVWGKTGQILANPTFSAVNAFIDTNPTATSTKTSSFL